MYPNALRMLSSIKRVKFKGYNQPFGKMVLCQPQLEKMIF